MTATRILICTAQVPFVRGGAEYLVEGLRDALRERGHTVDVVALPYQWSPVERIPESALAWRMLDITHFNNQPVDQVICTKFPSYLVRHPRKVVWLVHQHRQAYDWYGTPLSDFINIPDHRQVRDAIFRMDRSGLGECQARYTISRNVSARLRRFNNIESEALYPPSRYAAQLRAGPYGDYILSSSRMDQAKRLDLLLEAAARMRSPMPLLLAGAGPDRERLEGIAARLGLGERVRFLGFVSDAELVDLYAGARAVYYAPVDEDYGFATVEAFGAARPVVTTHDAGGVLEFVEDGVGGLICAPEPAALARALDSLAADPALAERMGRAGRPLVDGITWDKVVEALVINP
ncbi:glycosyltransferase family 4 protein [Oscillochloris sp. ZM17-4]|uniref:glycosyltransferase family 4 protein n=1 Tax=Oscillochloris sp. ZM17-4 TaxID=2866714 RepID=UPI001C73DA34|nr:glycosyltransferase family 4 protein [Oscillochloris sp. ZM17-4]MBX0326931.1 glycosyltransferase family 4 protein [Oscillochloris sp. ZM17-4]